MIARALPLAIGFALSLWIMQPAAPSQQVRRHIPLTASLDDFAHIMRAGGMNVEIRRVSPPLRVTQDQPDWPRMLQFAKLERQCDLPTGILRAVMLTESNGDPMAVSKAGARGLFQFMPATAKQYGINPHDPSQAATGATRYLCHLKQWFKGHVPSMLAGYNWGPVNVERYGIKRAPTETKTYVRRGMKQIAERG